MWPAQKEKFYKELVIHQLLWQIFVYTISSKYQLCTSYSTKSVLHNKRKFYFSRLSRISKVGCTSVCNFFKKIQEILELFTFLASNRVVRTLALRVKSLFPVLAEDCNWQSFLGTSCLTILPLFGHYYSFVETLCLTISLQNMLFTGRVAAAQEVLRPPCSLQPQADKSRFEIR